MDVRKIDGTWYLIDTAFNPRAIGRDITFTEMSILHDSLGRMLNEVEVSNRSSSSSPEPQRVKVGDIDENRVYTGQYWAHFASVQIARFFQRFVNTPALWEVDWKFGLSGTMGRFSAVNSHVIGPPGVETNLGVFSSLDDAEIAQMFLQSEIQLFLQKAPLHPPMPVLGELVAPVRRKRRML